MVIIITLLLNLHYHFFTENKLTEICGMPSCHIIIENSANLQSHHHFFLVWQKPTTCPSFLVIKPYFLLLPRSNTSRLIATVDRNQVIMICLGIWFHLTLLLLHKLDNIHNDNIATECEKQWITYLLDLNKFSFSFKNCQKREKGTKLGVNFKHYDLLTFRTY